jgi:hypothetical protein
MPITAPYRRLELSTNAAYLKRGRRALDVLDKRHGFAQAV